MNGKGTENSQEKVLKLKCKRRKFYKIQKKKNQFSSFSISNSSPIPF